MESITPCRDQVSDRFPVASFEVTLPHGRCYEVACATDPRLFHTDYRHHRTGSNFYTSRAEGLLRAPGGRTAWFVPPSQLRRFAGANRIYYALATYGSPRGDDARFTIAPDGLDRVPSIGLAPDFTGKGLDHRRLGREAGEAYGAVDAGSLSWGGDDALQAYRGAQAAAAALAADESGGYDDGYAPPLGEEPVSAGAGYEEDETGDPVQPPLEAQGLGYECHDGEDEGHAAAAMALAAAVSADEERERLSAGPPPDAPEPPASSDSTYSGAHDVYGSVGAQEPPATAFVRADSYGDPNGRPALPPTKHGIAAALASFGDENPDAYPPDDSQATDSYGYGLAGGNGAYGADADAPPDLGDASGGHPDVPVQAEGYQEDTGEAAAGDGAAYGAVPSWGGRYGGEGDSFTAGPPADDPDIYDGASSHEAAPFAADESDLQQRLAPPGGGPPSSDPGSDAQPGAADDTSAYGYPAYGSVAVASRPQAADNALQGRDPGYSDEAGSEHLPVGVAPAALSVEPLAVVALDIPEKVRVLRVIAQAESGADGYAAINADTEYNDPRHPAYHKYHIGLSWGFIQFTQRSGELGKVLRAIKAREDAPGSAIPEPQRFAALFGPSWQELLRVTTAGDEDSRVQAVGGANLWEPTWTARFRAAGAVPHVTAAQNEIAIHDFLDPAVRLARWLGLNTARGIAMLVDRFIHMGAGGGLRWVMQTVGPVRNQGDLEAALRAVGAADVRAFQRTQAPDLAADGQWGPRTHAALTGALRALGSGSPLPVASPADMLRRLCEAARGTRFETRVRRLYENRTEFDDASTYNLG